MEARSDIPTSFEVVTASAQRQHAAQINRMADQRRLRAARDVGDDLLFDLEELMMVADDPMRMAPAELIGRVSAYEQAFPPTSSEEPAQATERLPMTLANALDRVFRVQQGLSARQTRRALGDTALATTTQNEGPKAGRMSQHSRMPDEAGFTPDARKLEAVLRAAGGVASPGDVRQGALAVWSERRLRMARDVLQGLGRITITGNSSGRRWNLVAGEQSEAAV